MLSEQPANDDLRLPERRPFFARVESLRGLGALAVAGYHLSGWPLHGVPLFPYSPWGMVDPVAKALGRASLAIFPAHAALMMFFVISGYVLRVSLQFGPQSLASAGWRFLIRRVFRIYPIVIAGTALVLLLARGFPEQYMKEPVAAFSAARIAANFLLLDVSVIPTLWALQVELLMAPVILVLYFAERKWGSRLLVGIAIVTTALSFAGHWAGWPPLSHNFFPFVLGMLIPTVGCNLLKNASRAAVQRLLFVALLGLLLSGPFLGLYSRFGKIIEAYGAVILVSIVALRPDVRSLRVLDSWILRKLGLVSGSYYVLHMVALAFVMPLFGLVVPISWSENYPLLVGLVVVPFALLTIAPFMWLTYLAIEAPGLALGQRIASTSRAVGVAKASRRESQPR